MEFALLFFGVPTAAIVWFIWCLVKFLSAIKTEKSQPGSVAAEEMKKKKVLLIVSGAVMTVLVAVVVGFIILLAMAVAYM